MYNKISHVYSQVEFLVFQMDQSLPFHNQTAKLYMPKVSI